MLCVHSVIDEVAVFAGHQLANTFDGLPPADLGKECKGLQGRENRIAHGQRRSRVPNANVLGNGDKVGCCPRREAELHRSKRRNAASTSVSVANSRRCAWARPSRTAAKCAGATRS